MDKLLNILWNFSTDGFVLVSHSGLVLKVNPSFCAMVGLEVGEITGKDLFSIFSPNSVEQARNHFEKTVYLEDNRSSLVLSLECANGTSKKVKLSMVKGGEDIFQGHVLAIFSDISRLQECETELKKAQDRVEESDRLKSAFLANMSHEIRTPMNGIIGFSGMLLDPGLSNDKIKHFVELIITSCNQLLDLINDIIDLSRIEAGQIEVSNKEFLLNDMLTGLYQFFFYTAQNKGIGFSLSEGLEMAQSKIISDDMKLRQILVNILGNALKFTSEGSVAFGYKVKGKELEFFVSDTGIGIDKAHYKTIFDRFTQADNSSTRQYGGTGLGLPISKSFIEMLGGRIWFKSAVGNGTTFYFTIPFHSASVISTHSKYATSGLDWHARTILIAEDEEINFIYLTEALSETKINIVRAMNGLEVVDIVKSNPNIELILMDIKMPEMNGYEATSIVKQMKPQVPVIAQTAYAMASDRENALSAGCDDYISKPVKKEKLLSIIQEYLV